MGYLGRRIGLSQDNGDSNPGAAGGAVGGGLLDLFAHGYFERQGDIYNAPVAPPSGLTATGGVISDYTDPGSGNVYRAHIFTATGIFDVTAGGNLGDTVDYLLIGGGGGGGSCNGGGGGAGEVLYKTSISTPGSFPAPFAIVVGGGGSGQASGNHDYARSDGAATTFALGSVGAAGGGAGGTGQDPGSNNPGNGGGSGGGGGTNSGSGGTGSGALYPGSGSLVSPDVGWGGDGGTGGPGAAGGSGGGGAAGNGFNYNSSPYKAGGGSGITIPAGSMTGTEIKVGGGGGGGGAAPFGAVDNPVATAAGGAGVKNGNTPSPGNNATYSTGGGGGGGGQHTGSTGGSGGSGIAIVRYKIGTISTAKASGGAISFYGGKTIHAFTNSGTFETTSNWSAANVEYVVVAGGASGGNGSGYAGGGGGAGGFKTGTTPIGAHPVSTTIQVGAGGVQNNPNGQGGSGTPSYFGTPITSTGGGGGGYDAGPYSTKGDPGGSGGGNAGGPASQGGPNAGTGSEGYAGGNSGPASPHDTSAGGGGGGAGGAGSNFDAGTPGRDGGPGGLGRQVPATFRDSTSRVGAPGPTGSVPGTNPGGDTSGNYWVAGGGAGGGSYNQPGSIGGGGGGGSFGTPYAGGGDGGPSSSPGSAPAAKSGLQSTGAGGGGYGGGPNSVNPRRIGGSGGSGLVLIAYPS